ncbi:MAG: 2-oxo acid dehydrogenase subunit E2 [Candidatus Obscuribacterales bacterium]|nr:2-oxo acid dehydrogenase subunit E2 [Steroidobacteraceae bacterium]
MTTFHLPDLGEGLAEAEIVNWHVHEGDAVQADQPMMSVETAKAVVEVPCPFTGKIIKLHANAGDVIATGQALVDFQLAPGTQADSVTAPSVPQASESKRSSDAGTVVGFMTVSDREWIERTSHTRQPASGEQRQRVRAAPSIRILAKRLEVDLQRVKGSGRSGLITIDDVLSASDFKRNGRPAYRMPPLSEQLAGEFETLRGPRRVMAHTMTLSRDEIALVTLFDDADLHAWPARTDITSRTIRALVAGVRASPTLNAIFDPGGDHGGPSRRVFEQVHVGIAVDIDDKLLVPVIRHAEQKTLGELRTAIAAVKEAARNRTLAPEELKDYTISLSNFGTLAGRYATPLVVPPTVALLGTGKTRRDVVATDTGIEVHKRMPLSLSFDHRCITGGEACRFMAAVIQDLERAE